MEGGGGLNVNSSNSEFRILVWRFWLGSGVYGVAYVGVYSCRLHSDVSRACIVAVRIMYMENFKAPLRGMMGLILRLQNNKTSSV